MIVSLFFPWQSAHKRGRLVRGYFLISVSVIAAGLIASGALEIYFRYHEARDQLALLQESAASVAALRIDKFIEDVESAMRSAAKGHNSASEGFPADYKFELKRLLFLAPAISEAAVFDANGRRQAHLSRLRVSSAQSSDDFSKSRPFQEARRGRPHVGPVYFVRGSEPYLTVAMPIEEFKGNVVGVLQAEVNLKSILNVVAAIKSGKAGYAYVVSDAGDLIAHPEMSLVLQHRNISTREQVRAATALRPDRMTGSVETARNFEGQKVISSFAAVPRLGWAVFIERPSAEAYESVYASVLRISGLLLVGLAMALLASVFVARRVLRPLRVLGETVDRIRAGDLRYRVKLETGNEFETLGEQFNEMTEALQEAYSGLEDKVGQRTRELAVANERLKELDKLKSDFVSNVSHELRTPLTAIKGSTDNMLDGLTGSLNEKQARYLTRIKLNADRLGRFVNDVLDLSKIEAGKLELHPAYVSMARLVTEVTDNLRPLADGKRMQLDVIDQDPTLVVYADRDKVVQVLTNLIGNAIKFSPAGGKAAISIERNDAGFVRVSIADDGPGISPQSADHIFEKFYQVEAGSGEKPVGTGLGLAISKAIVEGHGGKIWLESGAGKGLTIAFTLPDRFALN